MRIYEERNNKRDIRCGYCFNDGHNKRHCPHMKQHWDANADLRGKTTRTINSETIKGVDKTMFPSIYHTYYSDDHAIQQFRAHWQYMKTRFVSKEETKPNKKRKKAKCGFCGSTAHNRRNCSKLKNFVYVLNQTNKAYRAAYYDKFVDGMGLGAGALVSMRNPYGYESHTGVAILTNFPAEKIMFTNLKRQWNDYSTKAQTKVLINGQTSEFNLAHDCFYTESNDNVEGIWSSMFSRWGQVLNVVSPAPNRPTKDWFLGQSPCFDWIVKKRDQKTLMYEFAGIIKHFYPHDNLRAKLGAKTYDHYYYVK